MTDSDEALTLAQERDMKDYPPDLNEVIAEAVKENPALPMGEVRAMVLLERLIAECHGVQFPKDKRDKGDKPK